MGAGIYLHFHRNVHVPNQFPTKSGALPQDVYVWQRDWSPAVREAVADESGHFRRFVILAAEISPRSPSGRVAEINPDYAGVAKSVREIGLAIRIAPLPLKDTDAMAPDSSQTVQICQVAVRAIANAQRAGLRVDELQIDFDCAESKLAGYENWVDAIKRAITPTRVVITVLPSWMKHATFAELVRSAGSYILQVHSLHKPNGPDDPMNLCDIAEARQYAAQAAKLGVPFRVAFPTYSYMAGFSPDGKLLGLSADGPAASWPVGTILRVMHSDPVALGSQVAQWLAKPPLGMTGIIWYRLPIAGEAMNWRAITLHEVMAGRSPKPRVAVQLVHTQAALVDIFLANTGDADGPIAGSVNTSLPASEVIASEAMGGFDRIDTPTGNVSFSAANSPTQRWIAPGERLEVGWLRLSADKEVQADVTPNFAY